MTSPSQINLPADPRVPASLLDSRNVRPGVRSQPERRNQPTNLDDTIWGALITFGGMGALCGVAMFGLVAI